MTTWATPYDKATRCSGGPSKGATAFMAWALEEYPDTHSDGIYNCREVRGGGAMSIHARGGADDLGLAATPGKPTALGNSILRRIAAVADDLGVQCVIYARRIYSAKSPNGRAYKGVDPHWGHLHIEFTNEAAKNLTLAKVRSIMGTGAASPAAPGKAKPSDARLAIDGDLGPTTIFELQKSLNRMGVKPMLHGTRKMDAATVRGLQDRLNWLRNGAAPVRLTGRLDDATVRLWQKVLGVKADGDLGPITVKALQRRLNAGEL